MGRSGGSDACDDAREEQGLINRFALGRRQKRKRWRMPTLTVISKWGGRSHDSAAIYFSPTSNLRKRVTFIAVLPLHTGHI